MARHPWIVLGLTIALIAGLLPQARHIRVDTHPEKFLAEGARRRLPGAEVNATGVATIVVKAMFETHRAWWRATSSRY